MTECATPNTALQPVPLRSAAELRPWVERLYIALIRVAPNRTLRV